MKTRNLMSITAIGLLSCFACGQNTSKTQEKQQFKTQNIMDLSKITDPSVQMAIEALQTGNKTWYGFFTEDPVMTDDGNPVDFKSFFANALGSELFISIDRVENDGKDIYGNFKAGKWGTFPVFFKFHKNKDGQFDRLDIGQNR
ncbi:hypothetical protein [Chryseobacterium pennipullorum]|uniref:DUF4783 domain-containing protein n=1 Tax=Chryseobacterium pennipullorum TaxID=2258963 RepID=A0A3D9AVU8_9FLAO|nr:hypothetical protein [Chryseobacterium pennipullorum]REC45459.1 hypothetical protein DRF67_16115 [Chryseobacterium pennipullorum]